MKTLYMNVALIGPFSSGKGTQYLRDGFILQNVGDDWGKVPAHL